MRAQVAATRILITIGVGSLAAGCVQPAYLPPGPIQLQPYPPPVSYGYGMDYRAPMSGPIPLQSAPVIEPLPPPTTSSTPDPNVPLDPSATGASDASGPIPVQDMPAPATDAAAPPPSDAAPPPPVVRKVPASGPGANVPLEGFRPMKGQTRPAP